MDTRMLAAAVAAAVFAGCSGSQPAAFAPLPSSSQARAVRPDQYPPVCTAKKIKSGSLVTSITAFGHVSGGKFTLVQPSSWTQVEWLSVLPPATQAARRAPHGSGNYEYFGTYRVSDGTQGCLYVTSTTVSGIPRIPDRGATLPKDFGYVGSLTLRLGNSTGTGSAELLHPNGSKALTAKLTLEGRVEINN